MTSPPKEVGRSGADAPSGCQPTASASICVESSRSGIPNAAELIERCEKANGPDRELSAEIALAVHDWLHEVEGNKPLNCRVRNRFGSPVYIGGVSNQMDYTASIDAAITLVPEGWNAAVFLKTKNRPARAWCEFLPEPPFAPADVKVEHGRAATPALALCAAALRASAIEARSDETSTQIEGSAEGESAMAKPDAQNPHE